MIEGSDTNIAADPDTHPLQSRGAKVLRDGQPVLFVDDKERVKYATLHAGKRTNVRGHHLSHDDVIGQPDGVWLRSAKGKPFVAVSVRMADHALHMPRAAQIVYPKDVAMLTMFADVYPGATVIEGGLGSGALTMGLLRAVGPTGQVTTYEKHQEPANRAIKNIRRLDGEAPNHTIRFGDIYDGIDERGVDRIILDVPEPWDVIPHALTSLRDGGILAAYVPTVVQMQHLACKLGVRRRFVTVECFETMLRPWYVTSQSVRPEFKMIGHTGFLVIARKVAERADRE